MSVRLFERRLELSTRLRYLTRLLLRTWDIAWTPPGLPPTTPSVSRDFCYTSIDTILSVRDKRFFICLFTRRDSSPYLYRGEHPRHLIDNPNWKRGLVPCFGERRDTVPMAATPTHLENKPSRWGFLPDGHSPVAPVNMNRADRLSYTSP